MKVKKKSSFLSACLIFSGKEKFEFEANDRVHVFSKSIIEKEKFVEIRGEVNEITSADNYGTFEFFEGMRVSYLI